jgi:D-sedoheptulose 7-phosphate isomerase
MNGNPLETLKEAVTVLERLSMDADALQQIGKVIDTCVRSLSSGGKILFAGNGGSAAEAQHLAAELVGRFAQERRGLSAIALSTDTSMLTAIGNDYGFERVFERQVEANGKPGDVFIALSTSGRSPNIVRAVARCRSMQIVSVGLTGASGSELREMCNYCILVPSASTPRIQEAHTLIGHIICGGIEGALFGERK